MVAQLRRQFVVPDSLTHARYLSLATYRRTGQAVLTPIWFAAQDGVLYAFSAGEAGKVKRLRRSSRARIAACGPRGGLRGPWYEASARIVSEPERIALAYASLREKYGWSMIVADFFAGLSGRRGRRVVLAIEPGARVSPGGV